MAFASEQASLARLTSYDPRLVLRVSCLIRSRHVNGDLGRLHRDRAASEESDRPSRILAQSVSVQVASVNRATGGSSDMEVSQDATCMTSLRLLFERTWRCHRRQARDLSTPQMTSLPPLEPLILPQLTTRCDACGPSTPFPPPSRITSDKGPPIFSGIPSCTSARPPISFPLGLPQTPHPTHSPNSP